MNLLITNAWRQAEDFLPILREKHVVHFLKWENEELPVDPEWVEGIIGNGIFLSHPIDEFRNLRYIQLTSVGYDRVPMDHVKKHKIKIYNAKGVYSIPMAEMTLASVLRIYKEMDAFYENQKEHRWEKRRGLKEITGKKVVIIGCGSVGVECAKRFKAFGALVFGVDIVRKQENSFEEIKGFNDLESLLTDADIVVVSVPLTEQTKGMFRREHFDRLKKDCILINIARGQIVDQTALIEWAKNGGHVVLDVFETEPLETESIFWDLKNVLVFPHNSFVGEGNDKRLSELIFKNLKEIGEM